MVYYKVFVCSHLFGEIERKPFFLEVGSKTFTFIQDLRIGFVDVDLSVNIDLLLLRNRRSVVLRCSRMVHYKSLLINFMLRNHCPYFSGAKSEPYSNLWALCMTKSLTGS